MTWANVSSDNSFCTMVKLLNGGETYRKIREGKRRLLDQVEQSSQCYMQWRLPGGSLWKRAGEKQTDTFLTLKVARNKQKKKPWVGAYTGEPNAYD